MRKKRMITKIKTKRMLMKVHKSRRMKRNMDSERGEKKGRKGKPKHIRWG